MKPATPSRRAVLAGAIGSTALAACASPPPEDGVPEDPFHDLVDPSPPIAPISDAERAARRQRLAAQLTAAGIDALVVEPGPTLRYLTDVSWHRSERLFALVVTASGDPFWLCPAFEAPKAAKRVGPGQDVVTWEEHEYAYAPLASALAERGVERVAVDPDLRYFAYEGLQRAHPHPVDSGAEIVRSLRGRKDAHEQALIRRACERTQLALEATMSHLWLGMTGAELGALVTAAQRALGLTDVWQLSLLGPDAAFPHGADQSRPLARGDVVLVDTGGSLHGYQSDITRTIVFDAEPPSEVTKAWTAVRDAQRRAYEAIRPGVTGAHLDGVARQALADAGYDGGYGHLTHRLGHGIGMQGHEGPYLDGGNDRPLEPGNTFSNEPGIYVYGKFGVRIEDIVVVTEDGADHFGTWQPSPLAIR